MKKKLFLITIAISLVAQAQIFGMDQKDAPKNESNESNIVSSITSMLNISPTQLMKQTYRKYCLERNEPSYVAGAYLLFDYLTKDSTVHTPIIHTSKSRSPLFKYVAATVLGLKLAYELLGADQITEINNNTRETKQDVKNLQITVDQVDQELKKHGLNLVDILKNQDGHTKQLTSIEALQKLDSETLKNLTIDISSFGNEQKTQTIKIDDIKITMATKTQVEEIKQQTEAQKMEQSTGFAKIESLLTTGFSNSQTEFKKVTENLTGITTTQKDHSEHFNKLEESQAQLLKKQEELKNLHQQALEKFVTVAKFLETYKIISSN